VSTCQTRLRSFLKADVLRSTLLAIALVALSMLHAASDSYAGAPLHHGHQAFPAADSEDEQCCPGNSIHPEALQGELGGHCVVYLPVPVVSLSLDGSTDSFAMPDDKDPASNVLTGLFRPPRISAAT